MESEVQATSWNDVIQRRFLWQHGKLKTPESQNLVYRYYTYVIVGLSGLILLSHIYIVSTRHSSLELHLKLIIEQINEFIIAVRPTLLF